jgi:hypothetical protein
MTTRASRRAVQEQQRNAKALSELSDGACELFLVRHGETPWNLEHRLQVVAAGRHPFAATRHRHSPTTANDRLP